MVKIENLKYRYSDGTQALKGISLSLPESKKTAILGHNGSGKSTLLFHLNGLYMPQEGAVEVLGIQVNQKNEKLLKSKIGMIFQDPDDQVFSATVWEDVAFGPTNMGLTSSEVEERVEKALKKVDMWEMRDKAPYHLSYGEKKRAAIAGVIAMDCKMLVLDEPVAYLDPSGQQALFEILNGLHEQGISIIMATHDVDLACEWADQIVILKDGYVLTEGSPKLLGNPKFVKEAKLRLPKMVELFQKIKGNDGHYPVTMDEAAACMNHWLDEVPSMKRE
ncbi:MAG: ATP-binding cassette domain-containing protein [Bacillota bacterium]